MFEGNIQYNILNCKLISICIHYLTDFMTQKYFKCIQYTYIIQKSDSLNSTLYIICDNAVIR